MTRAFLPFAALALLALPASAVPRPLTAGEQTGLRCAAAFALGAGAQARGEAWAKAYPPMAVRGREFFVRMVAQLMDKAGMDEAAVKTAAQAEAAALRRAGGAAPVMPFCLRLLDAQPGFRRP